MSFSRSDLEQTRQTNLLAVLAALLAIIFWSGTAIANKIAVLHVDGLSAGLIRSVTAGAIAVVIAICFRVSFPTSRRAQLLLAISGLMSFAVWPVLLSLGIARTSASHAALIMAIIPLLTVLISALVERQMPSTRWLVGAVVAFGATALLIPTQIDVAANDASWVGDLLIFFGTLACAVGYVSGGKVTSNSGAVTTTIWGLVLAAVFLTPLFVLHVDFTTLVELPASWWASMAWMALFSSLFGYALWFFALAKSSVAKIATLQFTMPVVTLVAAFLVLGEPMSFAMIALGVLIVGGTYFAQEHSTAKQNS